MTYIIAEIGVNHAGRLDHALHLIAAAKTAGADAVKFQAFDPTRLSPLDWEKRAMLKGLALTREELTMCAAEARHKGVEFMCTPMDAEWLDFVVGLGVKRIKVGSGQNRNAAFLRAVAATGLPVIISNGMCSSSQMEDALQILGREKTTLLYCISQYPTSDADIHLASIDIMRKFHGVSVGFSSHCRSFWPCVAAAYAGAEVIEAHIALEGTTGVDIPSSLLPHEFAAMVREIRAVERGVG